MSNREFDRRPIPYTISLRRYDEDKDWEGILQTEYHFVYMGHEYYFSFDNSYLKEGSNFFLLMKRDYSKEEESWYSTSVHYDLPRTQEQLELLMIYE